MRLINDILIKIDKFSFPVDIMVLDIKVNPKIPLILGLPFMKTTRTLVDIDKRSIESDNQRT